MLQNSLDQRLEILPAPGSEPLSGITAELQKRNTATTPALMVNQQGSSLLVQKGAPMFEA